MTKSRTIFLALSLCLPVFAWASQALAPAATAGGQVAAPTAITERQSQGGPMTLDVVVTDKSGKPVSGLEASDFTLLDNKQQQTIASFHAVDGASAKADPPVEAILVVDTINSIFSTTAVARKAIADYFKQTGGHLAVPTSVIMLNDEEIKMSRPTRDTKALQAFIDANPTHLHAVRRSGVDSDLERTDSSLRALDLIAASLRNVPGRKLLIWLSPGWPERFDTLFLDIAERKSLFANIVYYSLALRESRVTVYGISTLGGEGVNSLGPHGGIIQGGGDIWHNYMSFVKGAKGPGNVDYGDLLLPVIAYQTGGLALYGTNDLPSLIGQCFQDANAFYELTYNPASAAHPNKYREIKVQVAKPGLTARTRTGYYAQP